MIIHNSSSQHRSKQLEHQKKKMMNLFKIVNPLLNMLMKLAGLRSQTVEIEPGTTMHFWVPKPSKNKPSHPAVVFLHGFAGNGTITWVFQALTLARTYQLYVPDLLFFGGSATSRPDRSPEFQAECVAEGLRRLGVERCTVVGFSYGGFVGFRMAETYPKLVRRLVVSGAVVALTESISGAVLERLRCRSWPEFLLPTTVEGLKALFDAGTYKMFPFPNWAYRHYIEAMFDNRRERAELLQALVRPDPEPHTPPCSLQCVYFVVGDNDKIFNLEAITQAKEQVGRKARMQIVEKAGHLAHLERPFAYNAIVKSILLVDEEDAMSHT